MEKNKKFFSKHVFELFTSLGYPPHEREGAGHLNIGIHYFKNKIFLFRNFIVDFLNHTGLQDSLNSQSANEEFAKPLWKIINKTELEDEVIFRVKPFREVINTVDQILTSVANALKFDTVFQLLMNESVLNAREKLNAITLHSINQEQVEFFSTDRLEIRTIRPQKNFDSWLLVIEMFENRIKFLEKNYSHSLIPLNKPRKMVDGYESLGQFVDYIEATGAKWSKFKSLLPEVWQNLNEENFIRNTVPLTNNFCKRLFK